MKSLPSSLAVGVQGEGTNPTILERASETGQFSPRLTMATNFMIYDVRTVANTHKARLSR
jgi:hypothetical protein